ncbi:MAG TPA: hypothetical protein ENN29_03470 [Candidatus Hydrogenedentes bacterium]|nr:hypothetical protein [Candidatus Hydrogenedentota bacterium]
MRLHIIEGEAGCRFAADRRAAAVIVDALRASATATALLYHGATKLLVTRAVENAFVLKAEYTDALLFGERGGLPPSGFDFGNSPLEAAHGKGRRIIFTTTTGAGRMIEAWGATPLLMGSTVNSAYVVQYLLKRNVQEVVLVPAGLMNEPHFDAQEDWAAAAHIAERLCNADPMEWGEGHERFLAYWERIQAEGLPALFASAPHADKLRAVGRDEDIGWCARTDVYDAAPLATEQRPWCVVVRNVG